MAPASQSMTVSRGGLPVSFSSAAFKALLQTQAQLLWTDAHLRYRSCFGQEQRRRVQYT